MAYLSWKWKFGNFSRNSRNSSYIWILYHIFKKKWKQFIRWIRIICTLETCTNKMCFILCTSKHYLLFCPAWWNWYVIFKSRLNSQKVTNLQNDIVWAAPASMIFCAFCKSSLFWWVEWFNLNLGRDSLDRDSL